MPLTAVISADPLSLESGKTVTGAIARAETKKWELDLPPNSYVRLSIAAENATLRAKLLDHDGKSVQESSSIGGTGGPVVLVWITPPQNPASELDLSLVGTYPPEANFELHVDEFRPAKPGDDPGQLPIIAANNLVRTGQNLLVARKYREALPDLEQGLRAARELGDLRLEAQALYRIGMAHYYLNERTPALQFLRQALALQKNAGQAYESALTLNNIAAVELLTGSCRESEADFREALAIRESHRDERGTGYTLLGLADSLYCAGRSQEALDSDLRALNVWRSLQDQANEGQTENTLGLIYLEMGDWDTAANTLKSALALARKNGNRQGEGNAIYNLGLIEAARGNAHSAMALDRQALSIFSSIPDRRGTAYVLEALGQQYGREGDRAAALRSFEQSNAILHELNERYEEGYLWQSLGAEYVQLRRISDARAAYAKALALEEAVGDGNGEAVTLFRRAQLESDNAPPAALADANKAIALVEQSRRQVLDPAHRATYLATKRDIYFLKAAVEMGLRDEAEAFETSDAAHARTLLDEIAPGLANGAMPALANVRDVQAALDNNSGLVEYLTGPRASYGWVVTNSGLAGFSLPPRRELEASVHRLYTAITARNQHVDGEMLDSRAKRLAAAEVTVTSETKALAQLLFGRIPAYLKRRRIIVVPDGPLYFLPFGLLRPRAEVIESPSASIFVARHATATRKFTPVLVVANPETHSAELPQLDFSSQEEASLARFVERSEIQIREKARADSTAFTNQDLTQFGLIHIAAHAIADMRRPGRSGIILADRKIDAGTITNFKLRARLVTLSACDTAVGKEIEGEGIMSLSRAFLYAGAETVLSTLWPIDDEATSVFMQHFYAALLGRRVSVPQAVRYAQIEMQKVPAWRDPYYWAAFTVQGAGQ